MSVVKLTGTDICVGHGTQSGTYGIVYCIVVLLHCCTAVLLYCYTVVLLYCCTAVLLYCYTAI
jgi:hypothetical protein